MPFMLPSLLITGLGIVILLMLALWLAQLSAKNAALALLGWALGVVLLAGLDAWKGDGWGPRRTAAFLLASLWGLRLALYLFFTRVAGRPEEARYRRLRERWKDRRNFKLLFFFLLHGLLALFFSLPFLLACLNPSPSFHGLEKAGFLLWLFAFAGEALSDWHLNLFKSNPRNRGKVCQTGPWRFSRHPNYLFEWLVWCAYAFSVLSAPWGGLAIPCPALLFLILKKTGIPFNEAQALRRRGAAYRRYQKNIPVFFPWAPGRR